MSGGSAEGGGEGVLPIAVVDGVSVPYPAGGAPGGPLDGGGAAGGAPEGDEVSPLVSEGPLVVQARRFIPPPPPERLREQDVHRPARRIQGLGLQQLFQPLVDHLEPQEELSHEEVDVVVGREFL